MSFNLFKLQSYLKNIESEKSMLLENNSKLAEINLAREPELVEGRQKVADFSAQGEELARSVEEKFKELSMTFNNKIFTLTTSKH